MSGKRKNGISIKDISQQAGVSIATVSRVINKNGRYSEETERRVMNIIRENDYVPNLVAKGLRTHKMKNVGIIVPDITNEFFMKLVYEIEKNLFAAGYETFLCNTDEDEEQERKRVHMMAMQNVCSLIYVSGGVSEMKDVIRNLPTVFIDRIPDKTLSNYCTVESNNIQGGYLATKELLECGCKRILLMTSRKKISSYAERFEGYIKALLEAGMEADDIHVTYLNQLNYAAAYEEMVRMLDAGEFTYDGIFATSDWLAIACYKALTERGMRIPEDVKLVGYDDISVTAFNGVPITTIHQQVDIMGRLVVEQLIKIMKQETTEEDVIRVPVFLIPRESTRGTAERELS